MEEEDEIARAALRRPRIGLPADAPDAYDHAALAPIRRQRRMDDAAGSFGGAAMVVRSASLPAPTGEGAAAAATIVVDANPGADGVAAVVAVAATLAHLAPGVVRLTIRPLGRFGETVNLFAAGRVTLSAPGGVFALTLIERTRRDARTVAGVAPSHTLQGEWEWDADAAAFVMARGTTAWVGEEPGTSRNVPAVIAYALAAAIRRGDPSMDGVAVQVNSGNFVWRPAAHALPVALTARQAWGMSWPHDWDAYRAALDAALDELQPVAWEEETWLLAPQARDPRIRQVEERGRRAWITADGEPPVAVRLSRNARAILVARGLLPARDDA